MVILWWKGSGHNSALYYYGGKALVTTVHGIIMVERLWSQQYMVLLSLKDSGHNSTWYYYV